MRIPAIYAEKTKQVWNQNLDDATKYMMNTKVYLGKENN
jgi:hypothetical protein